MSDCGVFMVMLTNKARILKIFSYSQPKFIYFGTRFLKVIGKEKIAFTLDL